MQEPEESKSIVAAEQQPVKEPLAGKEESKVEEALDKKHSEVLYLEDLEQSLIDVMYAVYLTL